MTLSLNDFLSIGAVVAVLQLLASLWLKARLESSIKHEYDKKLEEFKFETRRREQSALVAAVLSEWISPDIDYKKLNKLAWEATLWLPDSLANDLNARLANAPTAKSLKEILVEIKGHLHGSPSQIAPNSIVHFHKQA
jgi:hypothetical protein